MISKAEWLRNKAQKCARLARSINDPEVAAKLEAYARELMERACSIESDETRSLAGTKELSAK
ncbi:MAG TPA: hypothetical protein VET85_02665 [Stellaceae bacterium]|nr:hypothetical protein [Stellaceae bacterium]